MHVTAVAAVDGPGAIARVRSSCGDLVGTWRGPDPVAEGDATDVELDAQRAYRWSEVVPSTAEPGFEVVPGDRVRVVALALEHDELNVLTLSVAGTFLLLDVPGAAPLGVVGTTVVITLDDLGIYPTGV